MTMAPSGKKSKLLTLKLETLQIILIHVWIFFATTTQN